VRALALTAVALLCGFAAFMLPARESLARLVAEKHSAALLRADPLAILPQLLAGTAATPLVVAFWAAVAVGVWRLLRARPRFGAYLLVVAAGHYLGLLVLSPVQMSNPVVMNRYSTPALPFLLLFAAAGMSAAGEALLRRWRAARPLAAAACLASLAVTGPFLRPVFRSSSFVHHDDFLLFPCRRADPPPGALPEIYRRAAADAAGGALIEYPWSSRASFHSYYAYQERHRRPVLVAAREPDLRDPRLRLPLHLAPQPQAFLASPARYLAVHRDAGAEDDAAVQHPCPGRPPRTVRRPELRAALRANGDEMARWLQREWGPPDYRGGGIWAWDLARVRAGAGRHQAAAAARASDASPMPATKPGGR
jgi:hypothetical protein